MSKKINLPSIGILEKAIAAISPSWALERHKNRVAMALSGGYSGGQYADRFTYWQPGVGDADANINYDLRELRARSRDQVRNNPIAAAAIETQVTNVIGTGLSFEPQVDGEFLGMSDDQVETWEENIEREWCLWSDSKLCDAFGEMSFYQIQELSFRSMLESGDVFVILANVERPGWPYKMALQVVEADRVCNENFGPDSDKITQGIERDANGAPVAIWVTNRHPGRTVFNQANLTWTRVPIRGASGRVNVIHLMRKMRPGQTRGVPCLAPVVGLLKQLERYSTAEVDAAVNSAVFSVFVKMDPDTFQDMFDDDTQKTFIDSAKRWDGTLQSGAAVNLLPGEDISAPALGRPNVNFDPFVSAIMRQIGMGLGIPYEVLVKHFQSSYSAARAALLDAWRVWRQRRDFMSCHLCEVVYCEWLASQVDSGRVSAPGFYADPIYRHAWSGSSWGGDGMGAIDPEKEVNAAEKRVSMGLTTLPEEITAYDGGDWSEKHAEQTRVQAAREKDKLAAPVTQPMPGAAAPAKPNSTPKE